MTTTRLTPSGLFAVANAVATGGTIPAVLADASDSTYVTFSGTQPCTIIVDMTTVTLPTGAIVLDGALKWRDSGPGNTTFVFGVNGAANAGSVIPGGLVDRAYSSPVTTQAAIDALQLRVACGVPGANVLYLLGYDLVYAIPPTDSLSAPTGTITTTTQPTVTWTHTAGSDGGPQTAYQFRVFTTAQYGIGGFDPATSPASYDSGIVYSSAASVNTGALANGAYRVYMRTAQTSAAQYQWATSWVFSGFTISVTTSDITSVGVTVDSANARNTVLITRNGATPTWTNFDLQRSVDGGTTWQYVRGGFNAAVSGSTVTVQDYETANTQTVIYRARASYTAGSYITGSWISSASSAGWTSTSLWLKDPFVPARNMIVENDLMPEPDYPRMQGVFNVLGATFPVVVSDALGAGQSTITLETITQANEAAIKLLASGAVLLLQAPAVMGWGSRYVAPGKLSERRATQTVASDWRLWTLVLTEVDVPAVT